MPKPKIRLQHFIACGNILWEGLPGPKTSRTLEGANHWLVIPPDSEPPFEITELWFYCRLFRTNTTVGNRDFELDIVWYDAPKSPISLPTWNLQMVRFGSVDSIVNVAWVLRSLMFPGLGMYGFQLNCVSRSKGTRTRRFLREEFLRVEK